MSPRQHERLSVAVEVEYRTAGAFLVAYSVNLSRGGIYIETSSPAPVGTELNLSFNVPGVGPIAVRGVVAWSRAAAEGNLPAGMGVEFENLDDRHGSVIDELARSFRGLRVVVLARSPQARAQLARVVRSILTTADVLEAPDAEACERAFTTEPDLVFTDLDESEADGLLVIRLAKARERAIPVIATARSSNVRNRAAELGADEVVVAPPVLPDLQAAILRAVGRPTRVT